MRRPEGVIGAFRALGESRQTILLAQGPDTVPALGQDLVGIALVTHVPDDLVARRIEHGVQRHSQFDHAKPGPQVPACHRDGRDRLGPQFVRHLPQLRIRQPFQVGGPVDGVEKGRGGPVGHCRLLWLGALTLARDNETGGFPQVVGP